MKKFVLMMSFFIIILLVGCVSEENIDTTVKNGGAYELEVDANKDEANKSDDKELSEGESELNEDDDKPNEFEEQKSQDDEEKSEDSEEKLKIISTYEYEAETVDFNEDFEKIIEKVHNSGGYVRSSSVKVDKQSMNGKKTANVVLRIPKDEVIKVVDFIKNTVSISSEVINSVDITDEYYNMEDKLENLTDRESRLISLYENATKISDIIEIDDKLSEIQEIKKEELRKKSKVDNRIVFSRVEIDIKEVGKLSNESDVKKTSKEKLSEAFLSLINSIKNFFTNTFVILIKYSPLILIAALGVYAYKRFIYDKVVEKEKNEK